MARKDKPVLRGRLVGFRLAASMRRARQQKGIALTEMAERLGYSKGHLSAVENGSARPSRELIESYERQLGMDPGTLMHGPGEEEPRAARWRRRSPLPKDFWVTGAEHEKGAEGRFDEVRALLEEVEKSEGASPEDLDALAGFIAAGLRWLRRREPK